MKLLFIGFHKYDDRMYPHLKCFVDQASTRTDLTYFFFRERGYFAQAMMEQKSMLRYWLVIIRAIRNFIVDSLNLWWNYRSFDTIIASDHLAYAVASRIFRSKKVILWSFDVISHDSLIYNHPLVRIFMKACSKALVRNVRVIIQDEGRLQLLKESLCINEQILDVLYIPVCLEPTSITKRELSSVACPRFLQSGKISTFRCSDQLLTHFQHNSDAYRLYFRGLIFDELKSHISKCVVQPMVSSDWVSPKHIYQLNDYCDIGFVSYADEGNLNLFIIAYASGQLVEFLRIGMPVIVMGKTNLHQFVEEEGLGIGINDISELRCAIKTITNNYQQYSQNCFRCFNQYFDIEKYVPKLIDWL